MQERVRWRRELERSVGDRDMLGTQLVRRNDELALLYEKLRLQEATIAQGRKAYGCVRLLPPMLYLLASFRAGSHEEHCQEGHAGRWSLEQTIQRSLHDDGA